MKYPVKPHEITMKPTKNIPKPGSPYISAVLTTHLLEQAAIQAYSMARLSGP